MIKIILQILRVTRQKEFSGLFTQTLIQQSKMATSLFSVLKKIVETLVLPVQIKAIKLIMVVSTKPQQFLILYNN